MRGTHRPPGAQVVRHVPVPIVQEREVQVPKIEYVEKIVEVPQIQHVERVVEVPQVQVQERIIHRPVVIQQEREVQVPGLPRRSTGRQRTRLWRSSGDFFTRRQRDLNH